MASTITLQNTIDFCLPSLKYQPLSIGTNNEPAITNGNITRQTILGPPFCWRWNRNSNSSTSTVAGTQDYSVNLSTFGFLEKATVTDTAGIVTELDIQDLLSAEANPVANRARPTFISTQSDDNAGNISFRLMPVPDAVYTLALVYQNAPPTFTALSGTWTPIPDYMSYLYSRGFLALAYQFRDDPIFQVEHQKFIALLLAASEGLSESQKNIFLGNYLTTAAQVQNYTTRSQQATQARGA